MVVLQITSCVKNNPAINRTDVILNVLVKYKPAICTQLRLRKQVFIILTIINTQCFNFEAVLILTTKNNLTFIFSYSFIYQYV